MDVEPEPLPADGCVRIGGSDSLVSPAWPERACNRFVVGRIKLSESALCRRTNIAVHIVYLTTNHSPPGTVLIFLRNASLSSSLPDCEATAISISKGRSRDCATRPIVRILPAWHNIEVERLQGVKKSAPARAEGLFFTAPAC